MNKIIEIGYLCILWVIIRVLIKYLNIGLYIIVLVLIDVKYVILYIFINFSLLLFKILRLKFNIEK